VRGPRAVRVCLDDAAVRTDAAAVRAAVVARVGAAHADVVECDVTALDAADVATVDALARLQLAVGRTGAAVVLHGADARLCAVIRLLGLADVLLGDDVPPEVDGTRPSRGTEPGRGEWPRPSVVEAQRQTEDPEDVLAQEVRDAADPPVTDLQHMDRPRHSAPTRSGLVLGEGRRPVGGHRDHP
jgi:ABC-type transporter Mla MlaB component